MIIEVCFWLVDILRHNKPVHEFSLNFKVVTSTTAVLLVVGTIAVYLTEVNNPSTLASHPFEEQIMLAWFQSVTSRTAGFNSIDIAAMTSSGLFVTICLMFIGASPSGTGGGIKTTTIRILYSSTKAVLQGQEQVIMFKREVPVSLILKAMAVVFGSAMTVVVITLIISLLDGKHEFLAILFEVVSAFATVGLSTGITPSCPSWQNWL